MDDVTIAAVVAYMGPEDGPGIRDLPGSRLKPHRGAAVYCQNDEDGDV